MRFRPCMLVGALALAGAACGATGSSGTDDAAAEDTGDADDTGATAGDDDNDDDNDDGGTAADDDSGSTGGEVGPPGLAEGIRITLVEANQGVGVAIVDENGWVGPEDRNARLMHDRPLLLRVLHEVEAPWEPRELEAVLEVDDGAEITEHRATMMVEGDPDPDDLDTQFSFRLERDEVTAGSTFQVRLYETEDGRGAQDEADAVAPAEPSQIGIEEVDASLEVVLVSASVEGCPAPAEDLEPFVETARRALTELHPLQDVMVHVRDEGIAAASVEDCVFSNALEAPLLDARAADGAAPSTVYVAVTGAGAACQAFGIGERSLMVSSSGDLDALESGIDHCGGLSLGLRHVLCQGGEGGADPDYPHPDGDIGGYGWSVETGVLYPPSAKSYLSFCAEPTWVSDYSWNKAWDFLQEGAD